MSVRSDNLGKKLGIGALGNMAQVGAEKLINFVLFAYLARHLSPKEFGTVALLMIVVEVGSNFSNQGGGVSLIARKEISNALVKTANTVSSGIGLLLFIGVFLLAGPITRLLHLNSGEQYLKILSVMFLVNGLRSIPNALLSRSLCFTQISIISLTSTGIAALGSIITLRFMGGAWSLVMMYLITSIACLIGYALILRPWPGLGICMASWRDLRGLSNTAFLQSFAGIIMDRLPVFSLGRWNGTDALGLYTLACRPTSIVWVTLISSIQRVTLPGLTAAREKNLSLSFQYAIALMPVLLIIYPVLGFIGIYSHEIIKILYGKNWTSAAPVAMYFAIGVAFSSLGYMGDSFLPYLGHLRPWLTFGLLRFSLVLIMLPIAIPFGALGLSKGIMAIDLVSFIYWQYIASKLGIIRFKEFIRILKIPLFLFVIYITLAFLFKIIFLRLFENSLLICFSIIPAIIIVSFIMFQIYKLKLSNGWSENLNKVVNRHNYIL
jgi:O-antigen/teichoic acid export membrane protein